MKVNLFLLSTLFLLASVITGCDLLSGNNIKEDGDNVVVSYGKCKIYAEKLDDYEDSYMIVGGTCNIRGNVKLMSAFMAVISMEEVDSLQSRYGDFRKCNNPGAKASQDSIVNFNLVAMDSAVEGKLKEALKFAEGAKNTVVDMDLTELEIDRIMFDDRPIPKQKGFDNYFIVRSIEIVDEDYEL